MELIAMAHYFLIQLFQLQKHARLAFILVMLASVFFTTWRWVCAQLFIVICESILDPNQPMSLTG